MKKFYNVANSIICCAKETRASIVLNIECVQFVLQNCEQFGLIFLLLYFDLPFRQRNATYKLQRVNWLPSRTIVSNNQPL